VLLHQIRPRAQCPAQDERDEHGVVELPGDGDEVRDQIEGEQEIGQQRGD
jgi:hypothetical protein